MGYSSRKLELSEVVATPPSEMPKLYQSADDLAAAGSGWKRMLDRLRVGF